MTLYSERFFLFFDLVRYCVLSIGAACERTRDHSGKETIIHGDFRFQLQQLIHELSPNATVW